MRGAPARLSLRRNVLWTLVGNISYAACQWGVIVCLAKLGSPEIVGRFGLGLAIAGPVIVLSQLQLRSVLVTDCSQKFAFGEYLALRLILTAAAVAAIVGLAWVGGYSLGTKVVILIVALGKAAESIADVFYAWFQWQERMDRIARAMMLQGVLSLAGVGLAMMTRGSIVWAAAGWAAAAGANLAFYTLPSAWRLTREEDLRRKEVEASNGDKVRRQDGRMRRLAALTWKALPLGMVMMFFWLHMNIPRYYLESYRGETELGVFTALAYLTVAGNVVMQALGQAVSSKLARHHAAGGAGAFRKLLFRLLGIGFIGGVVGLLLVALAGAPLLQLLYGPEYAEHLGLLGLLMTAAAISYLNSFLGDAMTAAQVFRTQVPLCVLVTLVTLGACWLWVPRYGMQGAAGALIAAGVVRFLASAWVIVFAGRIQSTEAV